MSKLKINETFGIVTNELLNRSDLSLKAKGLFAYIQSKPSGWKFSARKIAIQCQEGETAVKTGLKELEVNGYLKRSKFQDDKGHWHVEYTLYQKPAVENPSVENPSVDFPPAENPSAENLPNISKKELVKKNIVKRNKIADKSAEAKKLRMLEPMTTEQFVAGCRENNQRHINLIGEYADQIKPNCQTRGQWDIFLKRNLRAAKQLEPFTDRQVEQAVIKILKADYLDKWTLETVIKYLE